MMLVLLGPPGAGKGTQAKILAQGLQLVHLSTGDLFREHRDRRTPLGLDAERYMARGELVPDETVVGMVRQRLGEPDAAGGVVFDGFPRTVAQAEALDALLADLGHELPCAIALEVARAELIRRLTGRRVCRSRGHIYHIDFKPPVIEGACDIDGSELYQRTDDALETVARRLDVYAQATQPVIDYYGACGRLCSVSGEGEPQDISQCLRAAVIGANA